MSRIKENSTPLAAKGSEFKGWLKVFEDPRLENRQKSMIVVILLLAIIGLSITIMRILPLKEVRPYFIEADASSGAVAVSQRVAKEFTPDNNNIIYFIKIYIRNVMSVDSRLTTEMYFPEADTMSRGNARDQIRKYVIDNKILDTIVSNPNFKRDVKLISVPTFISDKVVLARYQLSDSDKRYAMTIHYALFPPTNDEERLRNPIGFYVTNFVIHEEQ